MTPKFAGPSLLLAFVSAVPATAQFQIPTEYPIDHVSLDTTRATDRMVPCEFNDDLVVDFGMLQGPDLTVAVDPGFTEASITVPGSYTDIVGYSPSGDPLSAELFMVGAQGLQSSSWDHAQGNVNIQNVLDSNNPVQASAAIAWMGATLIRTAKLDNDPYYDLVGIAGDGRTLLVLHWNDATQQLEPGNAALVPVAADTVVDLCVANIDGVGDAEVCMVSASGAQLFDSQGAALDSSLGPIARTQVETIIDEGTGRERIAWLVETVAGTWFLFILGEDTSGDVVAEQILNVSAMKLRNIATGFYNLDGGSDILSTDRGGNNAYVMVQANDGTYSTSGTAVRHIVVDDEELGVFGGALALVDLDADGDNDPVIAKDDAGSVYITKNPHIDESANAPHVMAECGTIPNVWRTADAAGNFTLHVRYDTPGNPGPASFLWPTSHDHPQGATHLLVQLWTSHEVGPGEYQTDPNPDYEVIIPFSASAHYQPTPVVDTRSYMQVDMRIFEDADVLTAAHFVTAQYVIVDQGAVTKRFAHTSFFVAHPLSAVAAYLWALPFTSDAFGIGTRDLFTILAGMCDTDGTSAGGQGGATGCVPDYPENDPPIPPLPDEDPTPPTPPGN